VHVSNTTLGFRSAAERHLAASQWAQARADLSQLWEQEKHPATASYIITSYDRLRSHIPLVPCRAALLRSFTLEPAVCMLRASALLGGIDVDVYLSEFNAYAQEVFNSSSGMYQFRPNVVILAVQTRDIAPEIWNGKTTTRSRIDEIVSMFRQWITAVRRHSDAAMVIHSLEQPAVAAAGALDAQQSENQRWAIEQINVGIGRAAREARGIYLLDYDSLISRYGRDAWHDEYKWLTARLPIAAEYLPKLCTEWLRFLHPISGRIGKVLATDLDNTLWGGILGEDGVDGIKISDEYPGAAYTALQRVMLDLVGRGILLAIVSKNNPDDVTEVLQKHPAMLLRTEHFAAIRAGWENKADSLRMLATELNLGLESIVFMDDNPVERQLVRQAVPEVTVLEMPDDPMRFARILRDCPLFERLSIVQEDLERSRYYVGQVQRHELEQGCASVEDFYETLQQRVEVAPMAAATFARVVQLLNKTNQFNLTTRRYSEQEFTSLAGRKGWSVYTVRVADRFGDNGIVGVCILQRLGKVFIIDSLVLSCRVIGRTVESAVLAWIAQECSAAGAERLEGWFFPTKKNAPAASFYSDHGFQLLNQSGGGSLWSLDLMGALPESPRWIQMEAPPKAVCSHA
jgi:FkbH-like protein